MKRYSGIDLEVLLKTIDSSSNGMRLELNMAMSFDQFRWYLKRKVCSCDCFGHTNQLICDKKGNEFPDTYELIWLDREVGSYELQKRKEVTFVDNSGEEIPTPDRTLLAIHSSISRILEETGAGEYLEKLLRSPDDQLSSVLQIQ